MKYNDVTTLVNVGFTNISSHSLGIESAYAVTRLKSNLKKLFDAWLEKYNALPKEAGITDENYDKRRAELTKKVSNGEALDNKETKELTEINEKWNRLTGLREQLAKEEVDVPANPIAYEEWHTLKAENKDIKYSNVEVLELCESILENILWTAPAV